MKPAPSRNRPSFSVVSTRKETRGRKFRMFFQNGLWTIGVLRGETVSIRDFDEGQQIGTFGIDGRHWWHDYSLDRILANQVDYHYGLKYEPRPPALPDWRVTAKRLKGLKFTLGHPTTVDDSNSPEYGDEGYILLFQTGWEERPGVMYICPPEFVRYVDIGELVVRGLIKESDGFLARFEPEQPPNAGKHSEIFA